MASLALVGISRTEAHTIRHELQGLGSSVSIALTDDLDESLATVNNEQGRNAMLVDLDSASMDCSTLLDWFRNNKQNLRAAIYVFAEDSQLTPAMLEAMSRGQIWRLPKERIDITCKLLAAHLLSQS